MEMVEEGNNQPTITPKQFKEEEDRISELPDGLLLEILSRLPSTVDAIRTGTLSKRWKYVWTSIPVLIFRHSYASHSWMKGDHDSRPLSDFVSFVDKALTQHHQVKLRKFLVETTYNIQFESQFNDWIRYAINCNVEVLELGLDPETPILLKKYFLINSCVTDLELQGCMFNPTAVINWKMLRTLFISDVTLDEDVIENILRGSPLLENLIMHRCYGYERLDITSKSVKKLVFSGYSDPDDWFDPPPEVIEINAPNILSIEILGDLVLWKLVLLDVSSLVEAELNYTKLGYDETTRKEAREEMLKSFIQSLRHVKELKIGSFCSMTFSRLEAEGFNFPSNVKFPDVIYSDTDCDESSDQD